MFHKFVQNKNKLEGSLTVEAALVLPVFIYCMVAVIYIFQIIYIHEHIQNTITEIGYETTRYSYVYQRIIDHKTELNKDESLKDENQDEKDSQEGDVDKSVTENQDSFLSNMDVILTRGIGSTYYKIQLNNYLDEEFINNSCVKNGMKGITTYLSSFMEYEDTIDIIVSYKIKIPMGISYLDEIPMLQRVRLRGWNGNHVNIIEEEDTNKEEVYVALHGVVYHKHKNCTYINIKVVEIPYTTVTSTNNSNGELYSKCEICVKGQVNFEHVYITSTGNRYHINLECSSLKRTINIISIDEVGNLRPCSRCYP